MRDDATSHRSGVGGGTRDEVEGAGGQTGLPENRTDGPQGLGAQLGALKDNGIAGGEGPDNGAETEREWFGYA
ncbi:hypothetical protein NLG97_g3689 [Lecanicillium saksenae]|uniref:Uncharacterized protein n=1 Tax=Lecanicillium saksenae TaxID=468837 RepID=A0ACC1QZA1_9HYPO|nr:hypothetical protein NLG97_g3689 [Lecanicillium saksenae]